MSRRSKIEEHSLEAFLDQILQENPDTSHVELARLCSNEAGSSISNMAIKRHIEAQHQHLQREKKAVIMQDRRRVLNIVNQDIDIIQLQYNITKKLLDRFDMVDNLPEYFKERMDELHKQMAANEAEFDHAAYLTRWQTQFEGEMKRKVYEIATLNRELRENSKFMVELREKAFEFNLVQEYLYIFMDVFRKEAPAAYEVAIQQVASNPKMQRIVEQQQQLRGEIGA